MPRTTRSQAQRARENVQQQARRHTPEGRAKQADQMRTYRATNREAHNAYMRTYLREWRAKNRRRELEKRLQLSYGLSIAAYDEMLAAQDGRCAICRHEHVSDGRTTRLNVDHDHDTGVVRGLLCKTCNVALGAARDDPELLRAMAAYLELG